MPKHGEVLDGKVDCKRCNKTITWLYQYEDPNLNRDVVLTVLTSEKIKDEESKSIASYDQHTRMAKVYCRHKDTRQVECGQPNHFELTI
ncbi:hypothetical protein [Lysinibacillus sphaericus]|uniref:hypothetical protein n=1 Tax=Lysinibacillus sphaericus TaxID=1421 RepID=UPI002DBDECC6|nr:hypothetical protein [Lysinibacillus sphaericus]MEB7455117.1 hypothetical protein [Lysinibacillus sphaericus]